MWRKGVAAAFAVALLVAAIVLLRRVSSPSADEAIPVPARLVESRVRIAAARPGPINTTDPAGAQASDEQRAPAPRGPSAGVWEAMGKGHETAAQERDALVAAFRVAPPCTEKWCDAGRTTLAAWQAAIATKVPGALTADAIECSSAGCWMKVAVTDANKWRDVTAALPAVTAAKAWQGPSIQGGPDFQTQRGAVISIWAILPNVDSTPSLDEKGVD